MSNLYTQIDMLRQERDEARADRDKLALNYATLTVERDQLLALCRTVLAEEGRGFTLKPSTADALRAAVTARGSA